MKKIFFLALVIIFPAYGQFENSISISSGISLPTDPGSFYDYWNEGYGVAVQLDHQYKENIGYIIGGEFNHFSFDQSNFFKRFNIIDRSAAIQGASTTIVNAYGAVAYSLPDILSIRLIPFIGIGVLYTSVEEAKIHYTFSNTSTLSDAKFLFCMPYGLKIKYAVLSTVDLVFEMKKNVSFSRLKEKNTDFTSIRAGISMNMQ